MNLDVNKYLVDNPGIDLSKEQDRVYRLLNIGKIKLFCC